MNSGQGFDTGLLVYLVTHSVTFRVRLGRQSKASSAVNGPALDKELNAALAAHARSLRASQEAAIRGVMALDKGWAIACEPCLAADRFLTR